MKWMYVKKALATALAVTLMAGTMEGMPVQAEEVSDEEVASVAEEVITGQAGPTANFSYENGVLTITGTGEVSYGHDFEKDMKKLVIGEGITKIKSFSYCNNLEEVSLPNSLTEISSSAFSDCPKLKEIAIPSGVKKINYFSFENCPSLTKVTAPGVKEIYNFSFYDCPNLKECKFADDVKISWQSFQGCSALADNAGVIRVGNTLCGVINEKAGNELRIPEGITAIVQGAFIGCKFTSVYIPASMNCPEQKIGVDALKEGSLVDELLRVDTLETVSVSAQNPWYTAVDGCLLNKNKTKLLLCPNAKKGSYKAPDTVITVGYAALSRCAYLTKVTMPKSVKNVEYMGVTTDNLAPTYFEGNAPKGVASVYMGDNLSIFYDTYFDSAEFIKRLEEWKADSSENAQGVYKWYADEFAKLGKWEIHYKTGTTGWTTIKTEYPRIKKWITDEAKVSKISLAKTAMIKKGKSQTLKATVKPTNATNKAVSWKSSNTKVAKVDKNTGKVTAVNYGTATITATAKDGSKIYASCKVTVPYTITYKLNKGTNDSKNPAGYYNEKVTLKNPTRKGYAFKGWYTDSKYKNKITSIKKGTKKNYTVYAKWAKVSSKATRITSGKNSGSKQIALKYAKVSGVKGYEISYTTDKNLKKSIVRKTTGKTSYTIKNLKKGKTYYVRVRTYKTDSTGGKVYSKYTKTMKIKIRK